MRFETRLVDADFAKWALSKSKGNRSIRKSKVAGFRRDMMRGKWELNPQPLIFLIGEIFHDGHHRMWALSGTSSEIWVSIAWDVRKQEAEHIDTGLTPRTPADLNYFRNGGEKLQKNAIAIARIVEFGPGSRGFRSGSEMIVRTPDEVLEAYDKHKVVIDEVLSFASAHKRGINAVVLGVVARALYTESKDRVEEFLKVLISAKPIRDDSFSEDSAAFRLREFLFGGSPMHGGEWRVDVYNKTERALRAFLDRQPISKLYSAAKELFPVPDEGGSQ